MKEELLNYYNKKSKSGDWHSRGHPGFFKVGVEVVLLGKFSKISFINKILFFHTMIYDVLSPKSHAGSSRGHPGSFGVNSKSRKYPQFS